MKLPRLPIGIQDFESLINDGYLYVDKTKYIYELAHGSGRAFFMSRPRRFGKSLFLSTLKSYWEGKKELFEGLDVERLEKEREEKQASISNETKRKKAHENSGKRIVAEKWESHPVFYFDFNKKNFRENDALDAVLEEHIKKWEKEYNTDNDKSQNIALDERFRSLIEKAYKTTGKRVVILVDEYDKPLLENGGTPERMEHDKAVFKGFFSTLKSYDGFIRFSFLTGVTKFSKVSIFSDLNHLNDISMDEIFSEICGITELELKDYFDDCIIKMANKTNLSKDDCYLKLKKMYDGYHFHQNTVGLYNPFSILTAFNKMEFGMYWFSTGTPTFLVEKIKKEHFDIKKITDGKIYASEAELKDYRDDNPNPIPLLYQTGYLTIVSYDETFRSYQLSYPNEEVKYGFLNSLTNVYFEDCEDPGTFDIRSFGMDIIQGNTDDLCDRLTALYASVPYPTGKNTDMIVEQNFQNVAYLVFMLLGQFVRTEVHSSKGRSDVVVETDKYVYIMELKRDKSADEALAQIEEKGYAKPYAADKRTVIKIGANFDSDSGTLNEWKVKC